MKRTAFFAALVAASSAQAFFDDFDGFAFQPHWNFYSEGSNWTHSVGVSLLSITRLYGPFQLNEVSIAAPVESLVDFTATARVGWNPGTYQKLRLAITSGYPYPGLQNLIGLLNYEVSPTSTAQVRAFFAGGAQGSVNAPPPGFHELRLTRSGSSMQAFVDGVTVLSGPTANLDPTSHVVLTFAGPDDVCRSTLCRSCLSRPLVLQSQLAWPSCIEDVSAN